MNNVLLISYYFPPMGGAGTQRSVGFVKYLPKNGWDPYVLTVKNDKYYFHDNNLLNAISSNVKIFRTHYFEPRHIYRRDFTKKQRSEKKNMLSSILIKIVKFIFFIDDLMFWIPFAYFRGLKIIKKNSISIIYSSSPPETSHIVAYLLNKRTNIPWVADFRDEWTNDPYRIFPTKFHKKIAAFLEKMVIKNAKKVISAAEHITNYLASLLKNSEKQKFFTITNGFDYELVIFKNKPIRTKKFIITHTGSFSKSEGPKYFFKAINNLLSQNTIPLNKIEIKFYGAISNIQHISFPAIIEYLPYVSYQKLSSILRQSTILLLIISSIRGEAAYTTKIFDYIASSVPILALLPPTGLASKLIKQTNTGYIVESENIEDISNAILNLYKKWQKDKLIIKPNYNLISQFSRKELTKKLATIFNQIKK